MSFLSSHGLTTVLFVLDYSFLLYSSDMGVGTLRWPLATLHGWHQRIRPIRIKVQIITGLL